MKRKILNTIGAVYTEAAKPVLESVGDVDYLDLKQDELEKVIGNYDVAVIGLGLTFTKEVLASAKKLKVVATATTGLDHIDLDFAKQKGVEVLSLRGENDFLDTITGTAELACGLMVDLLRFTPWAFDSVKNYSWDREQFRGHNLYGKTLGIVGMGRLGKWMARYGVAFGMRVIFFDPHVKESPIPGCEQTSFDALLRASDVVSIHVHLSDETKNVFSAEILEKMKHGAYLVNTARGGIVDEVALLKTLKEKRIAGYATDVLADELSFHEKFSNHPLVEYAKTHQNVIIVPHIGGMTAESRERTDVFIAEKLKKYLSSHASTF